MFNKNILIRWKKDTVDVPGKYITTCAAISKEGVVYSHVTLGPDNTTLCIFLIAYIMCYFFFYKDSIGHQTSYFDNWYKIFHHLAVIKNGLTSMDT